MNQAIRERTKWFMDARFGMFIHWGIYAIPACGEWVMSQREMTNEEYEQYFQEFDPTAYDPKEWAKLAKRAGMKYAVLTAKHHDGFCLFDSALTDYKATNTKAGRDLVQDKKRQQAVSGNGLACRLFLAKLFYSKSSSTGQ